MIRREGLALLLTLAAASAAVAQSPAVPAVPTPEDLLQHTWKAAGGLEAYGELGILAVEVTREEVTQEGEQNSAVSVTTFSTPGPNPGRIDIPADKVVAADDGRQGWAVVAGQPDPRGSTKFMIKRLLTYNLFTLMLPFSLSWEGVIPTGVAAAEVGGTPVWRLSISVPRTFFHSAQVATKWTVDIHRQTYAVVQAEAPSTDLGKGIVADGMRVTWRRPQKMMGLTLPGEQVVVGLNEKGQVKTHTRVDKVRYRLVAGNEQTALFTNPVPPSMRPTPPPLAPPPLKATPQPVAKNP